MRGAHETTRWQGAPDGATTLYGAVINEGHRPSHIGPNSQNDQSDPRVNCALGVIPMSQCRFTNEAQVAALVVMWIVGEAGPV